MDMFDLFNSGQKTHFKPSKCAFTTSTLNHLTELEKFIHFLILKGTGRSLPCVEGWTLNISCLRGLCHNLNEHYEYTFILTNRLKQDCLENLFSCIRISGGNKQ